MPTLLVVEDEEDLRRNLEELLREEGFSVISAKDGLEGYEKASVSEPDLILSDIRMPRLDGYGFLTKLQENPVTAVIPFIFLTARVEMQDLRMGMVLGADDYIIKPFKAVDVLDAINSRLKKKENYLSIVKEFKNILMKRVPHELRTPLVGILGMSSILCDDFDNLPREDIIEIADRIKHSGKRLHRRIEKFLIYTELLDQSQENISIHSVNDSSFKIKQDVISEMLLDKASEYKRKEDLSVKLDECNIKISPQYFDILLNELLENSLKFTEKGSAVTIIGVCGKEFYQIKISDDGIRNGKINFENIKAFQKFDKLGLTDEGMGMGLAIVKKIIEMCGGYLKFDGNSSENTVVEAGIPLVFH